MQFSRKFNGVEERERRLEEQAHSGPVSYHWSFQTGCFFLICLNTAVAFLRQSIQIFLFPFVLARIYFWVGNRFFPCDGNSLLWRAWISLSLAPSRDTNNHCHRIAIRSPLPSMDFGSRDFLQDKTSKSFLNLGCLHPVARVRSDDVRRRTKSSNVVHIRLWNVLI
jgi:hypothetical protein